MAMAPRVVCRPLGACLGLSPDGAQVRSPPVVPRGSCSPLRLDATPRRGESWVDSLGLRRIQAVAPRMDETSTVTWTDRGRLSRRRSGYPRSRARGPRGGDALRT